MPVPVTRFILLSCVFTVIAAASSVIDYRSGAVESSPPLDASSVLRISAPGVVEGATEEIILRPEVTGALAQRLVDIGEQVQPGQVLLRLDDRHARLRVEAAQADLASAQAEHERLINGARQQLRDEARALLESAEAKLQQAQTALERIEQLEKNRAVPEQEADDARSRVESLRADLAAAKARLSLLEAPARKDDLRLAEARIAAAQAAVATAQVALSKTVLAAPCDAQVLDIDAEVGELIGPTTSAPVVVLSDTSRLRVRAFVEELDAPRVTVGTPVAITADGLPGQIFEGVVASLSPRMAAKRLFTGEPNELYDTKTREVMVDVSEGERLIVGLRVDVVMHSQPTASGAGPGA